MTVYVLAQIAIHDRPTYQRYAEAFMPVLQRFGGRLLAADETPELIEGDAPARKVVLIAFDDAAAARAWMDSPDYQAIAADRIAAATGPVLLVQGLA
jgi:uncharacterized protein (DUF1330 family)